MPKKKSEKSKKEKKEKKEEKEPRVTRKSFILDSVESAGKKGIAVSDLVEATNEEFEYEEGKTSRMRVNNTLKQAAEEGQVEVKDGVAFWIG